MKPAAAFALLGCLFAPLAWSQCAPGIPSAGNPGCIPPDQAGSPYYQGNAAQNVAPQQPQAVWERRWGAIATDSQTGDAGTVEGQDSEAKAKQVALDICAVRGAKGCKVVLAFSNQCAAAVLGGGHLSVAGGATRQEAEQTTVAMCNGFAHGTSCTVVYSKCSYAQRIR